MVGLIFTFYFCMVYSSNFIILSYFAMNIHMFTRGFFLNVIDSLKNSLTVNNLLDQQWYVQRCYLEQPSKNI